MNFDIACSGFYRKEKSLNSEIRNNKLISMALVFITIVVAFNNPESNPFVFITMLPLIVLQIFNSKNYCKLIKIQKVISCFQHGINSVESEPSVLYAAGLAVYDGYFLIFLCFDFCWLLSAYINPAPAVSFSNYLDKLQFGFISGIGFLIFTFFFWVVYLALFIIGFIYKKEIEEDISFKTKTQAIDFAINVNNYNGEQILLTGKRLSNPGNQPVILWPGFYQNGLFYHLMGNEISIAEFLLKEGFDVWIFHPRGTGNSNYSKNINSMDDYACTDVPQIIDFVLQNTGSKPIFVGHSQGGNTALMSMMGICKTEEGKVYLSDEASNKRQSSLKALVTLGSYLDFTFSKPSSLQEFVQNGVSLKLFGKTFKLISSTELVKVLKILNVIPVPIPFSLRQAMMNSRLLRIILFPLNSVA